MTTLVLAHYPFGELSSDFALREAVTSLGLPQGSLLMAPDWARRRAEAIGLAVVPEGSDAVALGVRHVVMLGPFTAMPALLSALGTAKAILDAGGTFEVHNLSLDGSASQRAAPPDAEVLCAATRITARDYRTANLLTLWHVGRGVPVLFHPERRLPTDPALVPTLGVTAGERILGVCLRGAADSRAAWQRHLDRLRDTLSCFAGWPVLPLPSAPPALSGDTDEGSGTRDFIGAVWPGARIVLPGMLDRAWWQSKLTPGRYRALIGACAAVVTQRDLPAALAIEARIPVRALVLAMDRRPLVCVAGLANNLPPGSDIHICN